MRSTINSTNPIPTSSTASATEFVFEPMPIIGKHHVHPYSNAWALKDGCGGASGGRLGNRLVNQHLPHACFRRISPQRFLVSRFVAKTRPASRSLWRESGMAAVASAERKWTEAGIPLTTRSLGWVVSASILVTCCRKWSAQNWPLYQTTPSPNTMMVAIRTNLILALRKASFHGFLVIAPLALI